MTDECVNEVCLFSCFSSSNRAEDDNLMYVEHCGKKN